MGEVSQFFDWDIVLFAMIAAFLVLRLRSVLGRRDGHEGGGHRDPFSRRQSAEQSSKNAEDNVIPLPDKTGVDVEPAQEEEANIAPGDDPLAEGTESIKRADPSFSMNEFISGSKIAFEMILGAFAEGDKDNLKPLLSPDVYANFEQAIREREESGETLEYELIGIKTCEPVEAYMDGDDGHVTVKFVSEQVNAVKDKDGKVIDGDPGRFIEVTDFWTFARDTSSRNPNWMLVATRSLD